MTWVMTPTRVIRHEAWRHVPPPRGRHRPPGSVVGAHPGHCWGARRSSRLKATSIVTQMMLGSVKNLGRYAASWIA